MSLQAFHTSTDVHTPIHGGVPLVIPGLLVGSIACAAVELSTKKPVLLSNQHAFFPVVNGKRLPAGTKIFQKGDSVHPVAQTYKTIAEPNPWPKSQAAAKMKTIGIYHDSALAEALIPTTNWINGIGKITGIANPKQGMKVKYYGATSLLQKGTITNPSDDVVVPGGTDTVSVRKGLVSMDIGSAPGDSGSLIVSDPDNKAVGLLFRSAAGVTGAGNIARISQVYGLEIGGESPVTPLPAPTDEPVPTPTPTSTNKIQDILLKEIDVAGYKAPVWMLGGGLLASMSILMIATTIRR